MIAGNQLKLSAKVFDLYVTPVQPEVLRYKAAVTMIGLILAAQQATRRDHLR